MRRRIGIGIVGGGLAGLHAARLLDAAGEDYVLFEGRDRFGGRLLTVRPDTAGDTADGAGAFDLGATWYWPLMQPALAGLVEALGLRAFPQHEDGDDLVEGHPPGRASRVQGWVGASPAMRLVGGMASLVDALRACIRPDRLFVSHWVRALTAVDDGVVIDVVDAAGAKLRREVDRVLLAIPPRLAAATIEFDAPLPGAVASDWAATATWMAPHAKYLAVYPEPFWRRHGLSGSVRSRSGPMVEIHDASSLHGPAALFGFVGVSAAERRRLPEGSLRRACRAQLVRLLGDEADHPVQEWLRDWSLEPGTATAADLRADDHPEHGARQVDEGPWQRRLVGIASEWSAEFPGYVAGAIEAATFGVGRVLEWRSPS